MSVETRNIGDPGAEPGGAASVFGAAIVARMEMLTLALGAVGTFWAAWHWGWRGGVGLAVGALLSWVNFRWLKGSVVAFGQAAAAAGAADPVTGKAGAVGGAAASAPPAEAPSTGAAAANAPPVKKAAYFQFIGRYALLLGGVYVILTRTSLPAAAVFLGLFAAAASVVVGVVYQLLSLGVRQGIRAR